MKHTRSGSGQFATDQFGPFGASGQFKSVLDSSNLKGSSRGNKQKQTPSLNLGLPDGPDAPNESNWSVAKLTGSNP